jgi:hypothetical protein
MPAAEPATLRIRRVDAGSLLAGLIARVDRRCNADAFFTNYALFFNATELHPATQSGRKIP